MMPLSDADIMGRARDGDREVFEELVRRYADRFLRVAESKLGDRTLAEDVVQETFLAAYGARATYKPEFAVSTWLWTILLNLCRRYWKRRRTRQISLWEPWDSAAYETIHDPARSPLDQLIHAENRRRLHEWLAELSEVQADALRLRFFGELPFDEIAQTMNCSVSGAKRRVKTGLERLSERIHSLEQSAAASAAGPRTEEDTCL